MHAQMTLKHVMAMLVVGLVSACNSSGTLTVTQPKTQEPPTAASADPATQSPLSSTAPSPFIGKWKGDFWRDERPQDIGYMEMEFETADGDRVTGRVRAPYSISCPREWKRFAGTRTGERVSIQYDLGGPCKVNAVLSIDRKTNSLLARIIHKKAQTSCKSLIE